MNAAKAVRQNFELLAFESAVKEHVACDTAASALVDYLQEQGWTEHRAKLHVLSLRREEIYFRHLKHIAEACLSDRDLVKRVHWCVMDFLNLQIPDFNSIELVAGGVSPLLLTYERGLYDQHGHFAGVRLDRLLTHQELQFLEQRRVCRVGATWLKRKLQLPLLDLS